jgi:putative lipoprotein (rSAM/lipoprotein system)
MKVRFNRWYNAVLTALLAILGYESCSNALDEYGCPTVDYQVKGSVTDLTGTPIPGIKITAPYGSLLDNQYEQIVQTDAQGHFTLNEFSDLRGVKFVVEDIDGEANGGEFLNDTINVETLPKTQVEKGDGRWYEGKYKYEVTANIKLKKK